MMNFACERMDDELERFDRIIDRSGAIIVRRHLHDLDEEMEITEDLDVQISNQQEKISANQSFIREKEIERQEAAEAIALEKKVLLKNQKRLK